MKSIITGPLQVCTYLVFDEDSAEAIIIDPGDIEPKILDTIQRQGLRLKLIFGTHGHPDHLLGVDFLRQKFNVPFVLHRADDEYFQYPINFSVFKAWGFPPNPKADLSCEDGLEITLGSQKLLVIHTPGHSPGSSCLYCAESSLLFTGDTLFVGGVGRADLPGGDYLLMLSSIKERLFCLPEETIVYPGHDYGDRPTTTIGEEKRFNPFVQELDF